jgi:DNA-binding beta-propeller fold protein YncE
MTTADLNLTTTGDTTTGSTQVTLAAANPAILPGMLISGGGIPNGAIVSAVNGTTLTLSAPAVSTGTGQFLQVSTSYVYVTNTGDNTISVFRVNFTTGVLVPLGAPVPCGTNPAAIFFVPRPSFVSG